MKRYRLTVRKGISALDEIPLREPLPRQGNAQLLLALRQMLPFRPLPLFIFVLVLCQWSLAQFADIYRLRMDLSAFLSMPRESSAEKARTRQLVTRIFTRYGFSTHLQSVTLLSNETGYNIIAMLPGSNIGHEDDNITVIAANYDTLPSTGGVDDNGSGVAAVLEAARVLKLLHSLCPFANSVIFVLFDFKHKGMEGSHAFASHWLIPYLGRTNGAAAGVFVLDGLLNFDPFPTSQAIPDNFSQQFPDEFEQVNEHSYMGDYLQVVGRSDVDGRLIKLFRRSFAESLGFERRWRVKEPWLLSLALPFNRAKTVTEIQDYLLFLNGDHTGFWFLLPDQTFILPTIYVTDTLNYRGLMQYCHGTYCDSLNLLSTDNLRFLALAVDSTIRSVLRLAELQCMGLF